MEYSKSPKLGKEKKERRTIILRFRVGAQKILDLMDQSKIFQSR